MTTSVATRSGAVTRTVPNPTATQQDEAVPPVPLLDLRLQYKTIRDEIRGAMDRICETQALVLGQEVADFEAALAAACGTRHAVGVSSGTDALIAAMMALNVGPGDEVIVPAFTFFATAGCVSRLGATPVFCDIDPRTFNLVPSLVAEKMTPRTKAIVPVHLFGQCADTAAINEIACDPKLDRPVWVLEDAAQAIGATRDGKPACSQGWCGALSFYPTKNLGAFGDAGAVCCDDDAFADRLRKLRVHGSGHTYYHDEVGGNFRIDALQAAVLQVKLRHLPAWTADRRRHAAIYDEAFAGSPVVPPHIDAGCESVYNQYVVRVKDRDAVRARLNERGIGSGVYYPLGLHLQTCFADLAHRAGDFPATEAASREVLALPIFPELTPEQVRRVADEVLAAVGA
jgi:dTDP-4-amino-4,6-dideoxygalactose transaminase